MRRGGFAFPLLLVGIGLAFLLSNVGVIGSVDFDGVLRLWPLILVLLGVDLLLAARVPVLALALEATIVLAGLAYVATFTAGAGGVARPAAERVTVERQGERELTLRFSGGAGRYTLSGGTRDALVEATSDGPGLELVRVDRSGEGATVELEHSTRGFVPLGRTSTRVDLRVPADVRTRLDVSIGAGTLEIDLREVQARDVRISSGAGTLRLELPRPSGELSIVVETGAGTVTVDVPGGVEARVAVTGGIAPLRATDRRFTVQGGVAETPGYASTRDRVSVVIEIGAGSVSVR